MTTSAASGGIGLLDLPKESELSIDGCSLVLRRDDFVGIYGMPCDHRFHLVTVRCARRTEAESLNALTIGFVLLPPHDSDWIIVRRYDPQTEEVGSEPVDDMTSSNLVHQIQTGRMDPQRAVPYQRLLSSSHVQGWEKQTNFVSPQLLVKRDLCHGDKIVPGTYADDTADDSSPTAPVDGKPLVYPRIPFLDSASKLKRTSHVGTKRYLAQLSPADRTTLFLDDHPADRVLTDVLARYYDNKWEDLLGDIQLSYVLFLHLQCLASLEHWRDLVAMLSAVEPSQVSRYTELYSGFLKILTDQLSTMEQDFFEDIEYSGDNFFVPAIKRLCFTCSQVTDDKIRDSLSLLRTPLSSRFPSFLDSTDDALAKDGSNDTAVENQSMAVDIQGPTDYMNVESDDDSGPVVVCNEEVEASMARLTKNAQSSIPSIPQEYPDQHRETYSLLFAAKMEHEDVLMTCARILDAANDVSLVREAAAYLEEVEAKRNTDDS